MARPKKFVGTERDGFVSFRVPAEMSDQVNCLCFLLEKSGSEIVQAALNDYIAKHQPQVETLLKMKQQLLQSDPQPPTPQE
jgi:hypothetical protein